MTTQQKIINYCQEPRTTKELAEYCGINKDTMYTHLSKLQRNGIIDKIGDGRRRVQPAKFVVTRQAPVATESTKDSENLAITHAHNPFGLRL